MIANEQVDLAYKYAYAWCKKRGIFNEDVVQDGMEKFVIEMNNSDNFAYGIRNMINGMSYSNLKEKTYQRRNLLVPDATDIEDLPMLAAEIITDGQFMESRVDFNNLVSSILKDCNSLERKVLGKFLNDKTFKQIGIEVGKSSRTVREVFKDIVEIGRKKVN